MLTYRKGDLFDNLPESGTIIIPHIVNNIGAWGSGFVVPLGKKFPAARSSYLEMPHHFLGDTQTIRCEINPNLVVYVANMCAQNGIVSKDNPKPISYSALVKCMGYVADIGKGCPLICPKFGSDRAKGNWSFIEELINEIWGDFDVTIFEL
jgi:hypothetical protein